MGGFAVAYLMRPLGALVFGHVGDRFGPAADDAGLGRADDLRDAGHRALPTHAQIGPVAGVALLLVRCVMGFSVGGEYTGVVAYLLEGARPARRGLIASLASAASEIGALLAVGVCALTVHLLSAADLDSWGWRIPFLVGALLASSVWIARSTMQESPDFERQRASGTIPVSPLRHMLAHHRRGIARAFAISALGVDHLLCRDHLCPRLPDLGRRARRGRRALAVDDRGSRGDPGHAVRRLAVRPGRAATGPALAVCAGGPAAGDDVLADGERLLLSALLGAVVLAAVAGGVSAVGAVATAEQFPGEGRLTGLALGATAATAIFGGITPYLAQLLMDRTGSPMVPGIMIALVALCVAPVLLKLPETAPLTRSE